MPPARTPTHINAQHPAPREAYRETVLRDGDPEQQIEHGGEGAQRQAAAQDAQHVV